MSERSERERALARGSSSKRLEKAGRARRCYRALASVASYKLLQSFPFPQFLLLSSHLLFLTIEGWAPLTSQSCAFLSFPVSLQRHTGNCLIAFVCDCAKGMRPVDGFKRQSLTLLPQPRSARRRLRFRSGADARFFASSTLRGRSELRTLVRFSDSCVLRHCSSIDANALSPTLHRLTSHRFAAQRTLRQYCVLTLFHFQVLDQNDVISLS